MGDRRMAEIKMKKGSLYVYAHWGGEGFPDAAKKAIVAARERLNDETYAVRIIVDQLTKPGRDKETGYGLMLGPDSEDSYNDDKASVIIDLVGKTLTVFNRREGSIIETLFSDIVALSGAAH